MRCYEAQNRPSLLRQGNTDETQTPKQHTNNYCRWPPSYIDKNEDL